MEPTQPNQPGPTAVLSHLLQAGPPMGVHLGEPRTFGALTTWPLLHEAPTADYIPYAMVAGSGLFQVREVDGGGQVNTLHAINAFEAPVLMLEGEVIEGMQQTRVLNISILAPPGTELAIPVSCVESGRWHDEGVAARKHDFHMSPRARARKTATVASSARNQGVFASNQAAVWGSVEDELALHGVAAPTRAHVEIGKARGETVKEQLTGFEPLPGQCGVLAFVNREPLCMDLFDRATTLEAVWEPLTGSYAIDAMTVPPMTAKFDQRQSAERFLQRVATALATEHAGVGLGTNVVLSGPAVAGTALIHEGAVVHLAATNVRSERRFTAPSRRRQGTR